VDGNPRWTLDLRWAGLGQYTLRTPGLPDLAIEATQEAFDVLLRERESAQLKAKQGSIFAGPTLRKVARDWLEEREHATSGGRRYVEGYVKAIQDRFGARAVRQFGGPAGTQVLRGWRDDMAKEGLTPKTRRNYLNVLVQILEYAAARDLIEGMPVKPRPTLENETLVSPEFATLTEADFRALRAELYRGSEGELRAWLRRSRQHRGMTVEAYVAVRRLYLSFGFYTGVHVADLDALTDNHISPDFDCYWRQNRKSAAALSIAEPAGGAWCDAPEPLMLDVQEELRRLGRPFRAGELICGGSWSQGSRVLAATAARLNLGPVTFRSTLRRSTVREYAIRGWSVQEIAHLLGHVDDRMVRAVYGRVPPRHRSPVKIPWSAESSRRVLGGAAWTSRAKVVPLHSVPLAGKLQDEGA